MSSTLSANGYDSTRLGNIGQYISNGYDFVLPLKAAPPCINLSGGSICLGAGGEIIGGANDIGFHRRAPEGRRLPAAGRSDLNP